MTPPPGVAAIAETPKPSVVGVAVAAVAGPVARQAMPPPSRLALAMAATIRAGRTAVRLVFKGVLRVRERLYLWPQPQERDRSGPGPRGRQRPWRKTATR